MDSCQWLSDTRTVCGSGVPSAIFLRRTVSAAIDRNTIDTSTVQKSKRWVSGFGVAPFLFSFEERYAPIVMVRLLGNGYNIDESRNHYGN
jgi:galactitol-specific phosphotransferase system IIB component